MPDVRMPDGTIIRNVPPGMTKAQLQAKLSRGKAPSAVNYGAGDLATAKLSFGLSDRVMAGADSVIRSGVDALKGDFHAPRYSESQAEVDRQKDAYKQANPGFDWATLPLNIMGGGAKLPAMLAAKVGGGVMRQAAGVGAAYGAAAGVGNARGSAADQAKQVAGSTVFGGVAGPVAAKMTPYLIAGASKAAAPVGALLRRYRGPAQDSVEEGLQNTPDPMPAVRRIIEKTLAAQGTSPRAAGRMIDEARARGVPMALMDTGDEMRGLASALSRKPGPGRTIMRDAAIARQEGQGERVQSAITRDLGPVANVREASENLIKGARQAAGPLYDKAYAQPVPMTEKLMELAQRPSMKNALSRAQKIAAEEGRDPKAMGFNLDLEGNVVLEPHNSAQTWDYVKRGLDDVIEAGRDPITGRLKLDEAGRAINTTQREFIKELTTVNPTYGEALKAYSGPAKMASALAKGEKIAARDPEKVWAETRDMSAPELDQYRLGVRSALTKMLDGRVDSADKVKALVGTPKKRAVLRQLFGGGDEFDRFMATLADEGRAAATYGRVNTGSPTASNLADDATLDGPGGIMMNMAGRALGGRGLISNAIETVRDAARYGAGKSGEMVRSQLASGLSETDPVVLARMMREATRAQALKRLGVSQALKKTPVAGAAGGVAAGPTGGTFADFLSGDGRR
ncbi:MAG: hypothetical protein V4618_13515 [Pseudomonadota bacterium]